MPYVKDENGKVSGVVKLHNYTSGPKSYDVYLAVYSESGRLLAVKPAKLYVENGKDGFIETESADFESGNVAKVLVWENGVVVPAIDQISYR